MNCIEIKDLSKSFGRQQVLRSISCTVSEGSIHGFLGPNGSGKTTTVKTLLGLYRADGGEIRLFDTPLSTNKMRDILKNTGYLPQDPVFPEQYTGIEVMELVANLYGIPAGEKIPRIKEMLKRFDLTAAGRRQVKNYSRGMKQRLGLATVWLPQPKLIILDEPVSALDPEGRHHVLEEIKALKGNAAVFFSSHILSDVERVADMITIIGQGQVLLQESMDNIRDKYVSSAYQLKVPYERLAEAKAKLARLPEITGMTADGNIISFQADSKLIEAAGKKVLSAMLEEDIPVIRFSLQEATLEDVFLQLIHGGIKHETPALA